MPATIPSLSSKETALLTGEAQQPTWKSPNELLHERINFDDTIWGFGLAGGAYYNTPLRVTYVRPGSRAEKAHIYPGDVVLKINGKDSSQVTLEEAHQMIIESGINLMINVTAPDDVEEGYFVYEDTLTEPEPEEAKPKMKKRDLPRVPKPSGKCSHWSLQWPWKCKRKIIYKESNCYLVPSKFEEKHKDTRKPEVKQEDIVLDSIYDFKKREKERKNKERENAQDSNENAETKNSHEPSQSIEEEETDIPEEIKAEDVRHKLSVGRSISRDAETENLDENELEDTETEPMDAINNNNTTETEPQLPVESSKAENVRRKLSVSRSISIDAEFERLVENYDSEVSNHMSSVDENNTEYNKIVEPDTMEEIDLNSSTDSKTDEAEQSKPFDKEQYDDAEANSSIVNSSMDRKQNEDIILNGPVDSEEGDGASNDDFANKFENEDIPGMSKSEKLITNGR